MASSKIVGNPQTTPTENDSTNKHISWGSTPHESLVQGNLQESPATGFDDWEDDESNPYRHDYKDWILFEGDIPIVSTDNFFADLDAAANVNDRSANDKSTAYAGRGAIHGAQNEEYRHTTSDPVHEAVQQSIALCKALNDFEIQPQPDRARPSHDAPNLSPLQKWTNTYERHEAIAYRLEQPPSPRQQHSRQPSQRSGH